MKKTLLLLLPLLILILSACGGKKTTIDANTYLTVSVTGSDGTGTVSTEVDYERFIEDYAAAAKISEDSADYIGLTVIIESIEAVSNKTKDLSNGDKYTITWRVPDGLSNYKNVILGSESKTYTVSGLGAKPADIATVDDVTVDDIKSVTDYIKANEQEFVSNIMHGDYWAESFELVNEMESTVEPVLSVAYQETGKDTVDVYVFYKWHGERKPGLYYTVAPNGDDIFYDRELNYFIPVRISGATKDASGITKLEEKNVLYSTQRIVYSTDSQGNYSEWKSWYTTDSARWYPEGTTQDTMSSVPSVEIKIIYTVISRWNSVDDIIAEFESHKSDGFGDYKVIE